MEHREVVVIGAGPAGSIAAALLKRRGRDVLVLEAQKFPRFSIGESLLAHCLDFVEEAGMLEAVEAAGFQFKNGAAFVREDEYGAFDFADKSAVGRSTTFQVQRAKFDQLLADEAEKQGVEIRYEVRVTHVDVAGDTPRVRARDAAGNEYEIATRFILDASGFGRTLPKLLNLETPSAFPVRNAVFTHVADNIPDGAFDRNKIHVMVHPRHRDIWYWLIPFPGKRASIGVVGSKEFLAAQPGTSDERLVRLVNEESFLRRLLVNAEWDTPARELSGYAANVGSMQGKGYALLGNAAEFLDPVFSSGVTIALKSASLAAGLIRREWAGETVDWPREYDRTLKSGVDTFRVFVDAWYAGVFQKIIFYPRKSDEVRRKITSILAGYAWDTNNSLVADARRSIAALDKLCDL